MAVVTIFLSIGYLNAMQYNSDQNNKLPIEKALNYVVRIISNPRHRQNYCNARVEILLSKNKNTISKTPARGIIYFANDSSQKTIKYGDILAISGRIKEQKVVSNPHQFNYKRYLSFQKIQYTGFIQEWKKFDNQSNKIYAWSYNIQNKLNSILKKNLNNEELAVASALILGDKSILDKETKSLFSSTGSMHVLAVSGLHVGIIYLLFNFLLSPLDKSKRGLIIKIFSISLIIWIYAFITGLSPSIQRAAVMFTFINIGNLLNRKINTYNIIFASAFILSIINPNVIMEVGFQLSYLAVIGIIYLQPKLYILIQPSNYLINKIWELTSLSLAAQIATAPLSIMYFMNFPNYFVLSNLLIIPLATIILILGISTLLLSFAPYLSEITGHILKICIQGLNYIVELISSFPYAQTTGIHLNTLEVYLIYALIISTMFYFGYKRKLFIYLSLITLICLNINFIYQKLNVTNKDSITIYDIPNTFAMEIKNRNSVIAYMDSSLVADENKTDYYIKRNWVYNDIKHIKKIPFDNSFQTRINSENLFVKNNYLMFKNYKMVLINDTFNKNKFPLKIRVNSVLINSSYKGNLISIIESYKFDKIIFNTSAKSKQLKNWLQECKKENIDYYIVHREGAFIINV